ncbi:RnfABCDGE type electron transport complex subunit D [Paenibacillus provencensis]|uniref:RnfABCDGE type electron transport complex subunit D n=1 Tax=Paenibacillus provencensis TaxID=441151 RepID=A0ABW3PM73_9BACL|nr:RnfABCDGE type electron transport complex subunit D [Paenibacillus sp. MER 78]MCM3129661.1 RnfABCDGE type electron transport complex subunit D [Paenibacillus sp. MER 78]
MRNEVRTKLRPIVHWDDYKLDPRYFILVFLSLFAILGQVYLGFFQRWEAVFISISCTMLTELFLSRWRTGTWSFPLSGLITGIGVSLLLSSNVLWIYAVTAVMSISLKYVLRFKGGHIFNPNNASMVLVLVLLPQYAVSTPKQWTNGIEIMLLILILGILVCYVANRLDSVLTFIGSFTIFAFLRHLLYGAPLFAALGPLMGAGLQLFAFFMMTDPKSTPTTRKARILFAFLVALMDAVYRIQRIPNPQFYALFTISLLFIIPYRYWISRKESNITQ